MRIGSLCSSLQPLPRPPPMRTGAPTSATRPAAITRRSSRSRRATSRSCEVAWTYRAGGADPNNRSQIQCNPLIIDGVLYGTSPDLQLFALDAATGRELVALRSGIGERHHEGRRESRSGLLGRRRRAPHPLRRTIIFFTPSMPRTGQRIPSFGDGGSIDLKQGSGPRRFRAGASVHHAGRRSSAIC